MAWSSSGKSVIAALQSQKQAIDRNVELAAEQGLVLMLNEVHTRMVGHIVSSNMDKSFDAESRVEKMGEAHYQIIIANAATGEKDFPYPIVVEARYGMGAGGVHAAIPQVASNLKRLIEEAK